MLAYLAIYNIFIIKKKVINANSLLLFKGIEIALNFVLNLFEPCII